MKKAPEHLVARVSTGWSKRFFAVRGPGDLCYWKTSDDSVDPIGVVDLRLVVRVSAASNDGDGRVDVELADRKMKLRATSKRDADEWIEALNAWIDHAVEQDGLAGYRDFDEAHAVDRARAPSGSAPQPLQGDLCLKQPHTYRADTWTKRWFRVDPVAGTLAVYASANAAASPKKFPDRSYDLKLCADIKKHDKGAQSDDTRFGFNVLDHKVKLKASTKAEADAWVDALAAWQEFLILNCSAATMV